MSFAEFSSRSAAADPGADLALPVEATGAEPGSTTADIFLSLLQSRSKPSKTR